MQVTAAADHHHGATTTSAHRCHHHHLLHGSAPMQVYREIHRFSKAAGASVAAVYGGANLKQQIAELKR